MCDARVEGVVRRVKEYYSCRRSQVSRSGIHSVRTVMAVAVKVSPYHSVALYDGHFSDRSYRLCTALAEGDAICSPPPRLGATCKYCNPNLHIGHCPNQTDYTCSF